MTARRVATVFGGAGFIGRYVVQRLAQLDYVVRIPSRHPDRARRQMVQGRVGQVVPLAAALSDEAAVARAVAEAEVVVNLVGILAERRPSGASKAGRTLRMPCASWFTVSAKKAIPSPGMAVAGYSVAMPHSAVPARAGRAARPSSGAMAIRARRVVMRSIPRSGSPRGEQRRAMIL